MAKPRKIQATRTKKKIWFPVHTVKELGERFICELLTPDQKTLEGKIVSSNLMNITGNSKHQNINVKLRIESVDSRKGYAKPIGYYMIPSTIKRMIRRNRDRLDDSFVVRTSDKVFVRIKPLMITRARTKSSVKKVIRKNVKDYLTRFIEKTSYLNLFNDIIVYKVQRSLRDAIKKTYPLGVSEIKSLEFVEIKTYKKEPEETKEVVEEKKEEPKEEEEKEVKEETKPKEESPKEEKKEEVKPKEEEKRIEEKAEEKKEEKEEVKKEKPAEEKKEEVKEEKKEEIKEEKEEVKKELKEKKISSESEKGLEMLRNSKGISGTQKSAKKISRESKTFQKEVKPKEKKEQKSKKKETKSKKPAKKTEKISKTKGS